MDDVRTLPRQISSQAAVLGCLLIDPSLCGEIFARVQAEDFLTPEYRHVFEAARRLFFAGRDVDAVTICHAAGGDSYRDLLMQIMDVTPTAAGWREYVQVLREEVRLHRLRTAGDKLAACVSAESGLAILAEAQQLGNEQSTARIVSMRQGLVDFHDRQEQAPDYLRFGLGFLTSGCGCRPARSWSSADGRARARPPLPSRSPTCSRASGRSGFSVWKPAKASCMTAWSPKPA